MICLSIDLVLKANMYIKIFLLFKPPYQMSVPNSQMQFLSNIIGISVLQMRKVAQRYTVYK